MVMVVFGAGVGGINTVALGQDAPRWRKEILIEDVTGTAGDFESRPELVVDMAGSVHVFFMISLEHAYPFADTIFYRRMENDVWSSAVDIIFVQDDHHVGIESTAIDSRGYLYLLWTDTESGDNTTLYLSMSHFSVALDARQWSTQVIARPGQIVRSQAHMAIDDMGVAHIVYVDEKDSINYTFSTDYGITWSEPSMIWSGGAEIPRVAVGTDGIVHVTWTYHDFVREVEEGGTEVKREAVFYGRSTDGGTTWKTNEIQRREDNDPSTVAFSNIIIRNQNEVHIVWNRGIGCKFGRYHAWSVDNGVTWREPSPLLPEYVCGQTKSPDLAVDTAQVLHLLSVRDTPWYSRWDGGTWTPMEPLPPEGQTQDFSASMALGLGNTLHVVRESPDYDFRLVYTRLTTEAPPLSPQSIPSPMPDSHTVTPMSVSETGNPLRATPLSTEAPFALRSDFERTQPEVGYNGSAMSSIALSGIGAILLIGAVVLWQISERKSRP